MVPGFGEGRHGIDHLLETVLLEADISELKANKNRRATGVVIESRARRGRGAVATVLVQNGTLRVGDIVVVGGTYGKVRALIDDKGKQVKKAGPSIPVEIMGLSDVPAAGDTLMVVSDDRVARETAEKRATRRRDVRISAGAGRSASRSRRSCRCRPKARRRSTSSSRPTDKVRSKLCARASSRSRTKTSTFA